MMIAFIDTETTGVQRNPVVNSIYDISIAIADFDDPSKILGKYNRKVMPKKRDMGNPDVLEFLGKTMDDLRAEGEITQEECVIEILKFIKPFETDGRLFLAGYNSMFDHDFLRDMFDFAGNKKFGHHFIYPPICIMQAAMLHLLMHRESLPNFKLFTVFETITELKVDPSRLHTARYDNWMGYKIFTKIFGG